MERQWIDSVLSEFFFMVTQSSRCPVVSLLWANVLLHLAILFYHISCILLFVKTTLLFGGLWYCRSIIHCCEIQVYTISSFWYVFVFVTLGFVQKHRLQSGVKQQALVLIQMNFSETILSQKMCLPLSLANSCRMIWNKFSKSPCFVEGCWGRMERGNSGFERSNVPWTTGWCSLALN